MTPQRVDLRKHLERDVPLACAATRSRRRRNDVDEKDGCRNSAQEMTPQRLW